MEHLPTIEGNPPTPRPIRLVERWRVSWHGRRDAKKRSGDCDGVGPAPYLNSLRAQAETGQQAVGTWLHQQVVPVDREAVRLLTLLDQYRREPVDPPTATLTRVPPDEADPRPAFRIPAWVVEARQAAELHRAYQRRIQEQKKAEQQLGQLGSIRHHLIETARCAAAAHLSRFEQLVGLYNAALNRRYPRRPQPGPPRTAPPVTPESWMHGDLPLLALEVDNQLAENYRWFLKEFATRTSADRHPVPVEVPRAG
ncbi:MAG TPA: hypothetical protein VHH34_25430 [Pseudonocardiaceae bacterium]|nr:hypothetical protein [Pseudonocardiaceae bacterium]